MQSNPKPFKAVLGLVASSPQAERIVSSLKTSGFRDDDISVLFPDRSGTREFADEHHTSAPEGAVVGAGAGGVVGGTLGLLAGLGALAIPGVGPFIAAGPILAALSGIAAGASVGGLAGALIGLGIPEAEASHYEGKLRDGCILVSIHVDDNAWRGRAKEILLAHGATDVTTVGEASTPRSPIQVSSPA